MPPLTRSKARFQPNPEGAPTRELREQRYNECLLTEYTGELATYTAILAVATVLLVLFGGAQGVFLFRADKTARISADAAKAAADALPNVERAYVFFRDTRSFHGSLPQNPGEAKTLSISPIFDNLGKTPAILQSFHCGIIATPSIPIEGDILRLTEQRIAVRVIGAGGWFDPTVKVEMRSDWKPRPMSMPHEHRVFLVGLLKYDDVFRCRQETCFCWVFDWDGNTFKEALDVPSLNYSAKQA